MSLKFADHHSKRYEPPNIDLENKNDSHVLLLDLVGENKNVLEVGTSTGYISRILKDHGNTVTGIEIDPEAGEIARQYCDSIIIGDIEKLDLDAYLVPSSFDVIMFGDVLEHLVSPEDVLRKVKKYLRSDGFLAVSLPNVCHGDVILNLLMGDFKYTSTGLLDVTHLRFFGLRNIVDLFNRSGYSITDVHTTVLPVGSTELRTDPGIVPEDLTTFVKSLPNASVYQYVFVARPSLGQGVVEAVPVPDLNNLFREAIQRCIRAETRPLLEDLHAYEVRNVSLNEQIKQQKEEVRFLQRGIADRDARIASLDEDIKQKATQLVYLSNELASIKQSIVWRLLMGYHYGFVEKVLPHNTRRREIYDLGLKGSRILVNDGLKALLPKIGQYYRFKKSVNGQSICPGSLLPDESHNRFIKEDPDNATNNLVAKYIRGKGICVGKIENFPRLPKNVDVSYVDAENVTEVLEDDRRESWTSCHINSLAGDCGRESDKLDFFMAINMAERMGSPQVFFEQCLGLLKTGGILYLSTNSDLSSEFKDVLISFATAKQCTLGRNDTALDPCGLNDYLKIVEVDENKTPSQGEAERVYILKKTGYLDQIEGMLEACQNPKTQDAYQLDVVIPVYNAYDDLIRCLYSLLKYPENFRIILINDCSTDFRISRLFSRLRALHSDRLVLLENKKNLGFVKTVNRGMKYSKNDVILLNSDTIVTRGWAVKLRQCAYSDACIATVTPFTNNGTICSIPIFCETNDVPLGFTVDSFGEFIEQISFRRYPDVPTAVGFCMYIKREVLDRIGYFDEDSFGKGYGEENDFCMRVISCRYKNVLCDDTFVFHRGEASFSAEKLELSQKNLEILSQKYPDYLSIVDTYIHSNPLIELHDNIQRRIKTWDPGRHKNKILFLLHTWGGGTEKHVIDLITGFRNCVFYILQVERKRAILTEVNNGQEARYVFSMDAPIDHFEFHNDGYEKILCTIIDTFGIELIHIHHLIGHTFDVATVAKQRKIPLIYTIHDFYSVCPNINLLDCNYRLCLGDFSVARCDTCLRKSKGFNAGFIKTWRSHFKTIFEVCDVIVCPSHSSSNILSMYYPNTKDKTIVIEHGVDEMTAGCIRDRPNSLDIPRDEPLHIAFIGGLGPNKGRDLFYALARSKEFEGRVIWSIFGVSDLHSNPGYYTRYNIHVSGSYKSFDELKSRVEKERVDLILFPSICPETFSYTLSEAWALGIPVVVSGLGALKERVEKYGGGWIVDGFDLDGFKAKIVEIINSPEDYSEKKREVRDISLRTIEKMVDDYRCLYNRYRMTEPDHSSDQSVMSTDQSVMSNDVLYQSMKTL